MSEMGQVEAQVASREAAKALTASAMINPAKLKKELTADIDALVVVLQKELGPPIGRAESLYNVLSGAATNPPAIALETRVKALENATGGIPHSGTSRGFSLSTGPPMPPVVMESDVARIETELKAVYARVKKVEVTGRSDSVSIGMHSWNSRDDMREWIKLHIHMSNPSWRGFYDCVSLLDSIRSNHMRVTENMDLSTQTSKNKLTIPEATTATSFMNLLPTMFAAKPEDAEQSIHPLPALKKYDQWNANDETSGLSVTITKGLIDKSKTLETNIDTWFTPGTPPHTVALAFLAKSISFIEKLSANFMEKWYRQLQTTSSADGKESWLLVCSAVKAIFRWLQEVRSPAAEALSQYDRLESTTDILWATARCQMRMRELMMADFRHHQVVATALNVHLFENRVPMALYDRMVSRVQKLEQELGRQDKMKDKLTALEAENKSIKSGLDSVRSQIAELKKKK